MPARVVQIFIYWMKIVKNKKVFDYRSDCYFFFKILAVFWNREKGVTGLTSHQKTDSNCNKDHCW